jgi:hypothetical protein
VLLLLLPFHGSSSRCGYVSTSILTVLKISHLNIVEAYLV